MIKEFIEYCNNNEDISVTKYINEDTSLFFDLDNAKNFIYSEMDEANKAEIIKALYQTKEYAEKNRDHNKKYSLDNLFDIFKSFCSVDLIGKSRFDLLYKAINGVDLKHDDFSTENKLYATIKKLKDIGCRAEHINEFIQLFINNPAELDPDVFVNRISFNDCAEYEAIALFYELKNYIKTNEIGVLDALCASSYEEVNDVIIENKVILKIFQDSFNKDKDNNRIYIFFPSLFFIRKWIKNGILRQHETIFVINDDLIASILSASIKRNNISFQTTKEFIDFSFNTLNCPSKSLLFLNRFYASSTFNDVLSKITKNTFDEHFLFIFGSDIDTVKEYSFISKYSDKLAIDNVWLMPNEIENATIPKRKSLLSCKYGYISEGVENIDIHKYYFSSNNKQYISSKTFNISVLKDDLFNKNTSIRSLFREKEKELEFKGNSKRKERVSFYYSEEITFYATITDNGSKADVRAFFTDLITNRVIKDSVIHTKLKNKEEINEWMLGVYPYYLSVNKNINKLYIDTHQNIFNRYMSLKSFVYFVYEDICKYGETHKRVIEDLNDTNIATFTISCISSSLLDEYLITQYIENANPSLDFNVALSAIIDIFNIAVEYKLIRENPAKNLKIEKYSQTRNYEMQDVKSALNRKFFYKEELKDIYSYINKQINNGNPEGIASLLRLVLGILPVESCAFTWSNFIKVSVGNLSYYKLSVTKQIDKNSLERIPLKNSNRLRYVVLPDFVSRILLNERERQFNDIANKDENYLANLSIVSGKDKILNGQTMVSNPITVQNNERKLLKKILKDEEIALMPVGNNDMAETDLSYYRGDIFVTNLRHYGCFVTRYFEINQINYLLGLKKTNTFFDNYFDFSNINSEVFLYKSLNKLWGELLKDE